MKTVISVVVVSVLIGVGIASHALEIGSKNASTDETIKSGKSEQQTQLTFSSFDGGGPSYNVVLDKEIVSYNSEIKYRNPKHAEMEGSGYDVIFTFTGLNQGETKMTVEERSPIAGNFDHIYTVKVDENMNVTIDKLSEKDLDAPSPTPMLVIRANDKVFYAYFEENESARVFAEKLSEHGITVDMHDYNNFEKVGQLPWSLPTNDESITTQPGDIILYQGSQITVYYDQNTWDFTRLAKINYVTKEELLETLGSGDVTVSFEVEWSE